MSDRRTRRGLHLRRVQVTLSTAKLSARVGAVHEKARPGGICLCINRREINELGDWRGKTLAKVREIILIWARCRRQNLIRADNEVAVQERIEPEKCQGDPGAMVIHPKKEERQRLQLFHAEYTQVVRASQDEQGGDEKEAAKSLDDATGDAQERGNQRDAPARRLKQVIKESCHSDLAGHFDEVDCETQLKQAPVCQYVRRRSRCVAVYHKAAAHETLGEYSRQHGEEIKGTGNPGLETRRRFLQPPHHCSCIHIASFSCVCLNSNRSPGWHWSASQMAASVENRTARAFPVFRIDRLASVIPILSDSSVSVIRRS